MLVLDAGLLFYAAKRIEEQVRAPNDFFYNPSEEEERILENDGHTTRNNSTSNRNGFSPESKPNHRRCTKILHMITGIRIRIFNDNIIFYSETVLLVVLLPNVKPTIK